MDNLTVKTEKEKNKYFSLYYRAMIGVYDKYKKELEDGDVTAISKLIFYGLKAIIHQPEATNYENSLSELQSISAVRRLIGRLTPNEFMNIFPISKEYGGGWYGIKDYYYTKSYIDKMDRDKPIGHKAMELLFEYTNDDIHDFSIRSIKCVSDLRKYEGHLDLMEEFIASKGRDTPNTFKNSKGKPMYVRNGKPIAIEGHNPFQLVK